MRLLWEKYSYVMILVALSLTGAILLSFVFPSATDDLLTITVSEGDTLWNLAEEYKDHHRLSKDEFIKWVEQYNGVNAAKIYPGKELILPVKGSLIQENEINNLASN